MRRIGFILASMRSFMHMELIYDFFLNFEETDMCSLLPRDVICLTCSCFCFRKLTFFQYLLFQKILTGTQAVRIQIGPTFCLGVT